MRIAQANLGRSRLASDELVVSAVGEGFDVLLIAEPYTHKGRACALGSSSHVVITGQKGDETPWTAVVVLSPNITATHRQQYSSAHCVCVELSGAFGSVVVISQYHQFSHEPEVHIDYLDLLLSRLGSRRVIIGMDLNGTSPQWSSRVQVADERGLLLEEVIHRHGLAAVYRPGHPRTLVRGDKDVDVTLVTSKLEAQVCDWTVREGRTTADHRPIAYCLREQVTSGVRGHQGTTCAGLTGEGVGGRSRSCWRRSPVRILRFGSAGGGCTCSGSERCSACRDRNRDTKEKILSPLSSLVERGADWA
ncbi:unnamed protein product [Trichogramma brassicae]|uniref:Endonuclease/exonuclease/phosphatase domain-containing protein n=1 Tax=Trichogramma brassicae TaxID=86971 RepID=A0A6H5ID05_9HYME|nr:unnamed protein product [Trichogramma brassicae]